MKYMSNRPRADFVEWTDTPELLLRGFGPGRVEREGRALTSADWTYSKAREMLFYLACHPSRTKEQIGLALWPDISAVQLDQHFRVTLHHLRRALGDPDWILYGDGRYTFNRAFPFWFDVDAFEFNLSLAEVALEGAADGAARASDHLERAISLYRGDFLEDYDAEWCLARREELRRIYLEGLLAWGGLLMDAGQHDQAAQVYRRAILCDPYIEAAHRALMRCLARQGEVGLALRQYRTVARLLEEELGGSPAPETIALHEHLRRGEPI